MAFNGFFQFLITFHTSVLITKSHTEKDINTLSSKCCLLYFNANYWLL